VLAHDAERERLGVLAEHWWRGWDQWTPPPSRQLPPSHRTPRSGAGPLQGPRRPSVRRAQLPRWKSSSSGSRPGT
jgi:hypothetical protein